MFLMKREFMSITSQYLIFFVNGAFLGLLAWTFQYYLYMFLDKNSFLNYAIATAMTYIVFVTANCIIQRHIIFRTEIVLVRYFAAQAFIMVLLILISPICMRLIDYIFQPPNGEMFGFPVAGLVISFPSFILSRFWAFNKK